MGGSQRSERLPFGMEWEREAFPEICGPSGAGVHCLALLSGRRGKGVEWVWRRETAHWRRGADGVPLAGWASLFADS
jgi:hypothetical protein